MMLNKILTVIAQIVLAVEAAAMAFLMAAWIRDSFWNPEYDSWARVTHWMPLPEPPKEEIYE